MTEPAKTPPSNPVNWQQIQAERRLMTDQNSDGHVGLSKEDIAKHDNPKLQSNYDQLRKLEKNKSDRDGTKLQGSLVGFRAAGQNMLKAVMSIVHSGNGSQEGSKYNLGKISHAKMLTRMQDYHYQETNGEEWSTQVGFLGEYEFEADYDPNQSEEDLQDIQDKLKKHLLEEFAKNGIKFNPDDVKIETTLQAYEDYTDLENRVRYQDTSLTIERTFRRVFIISFPLKNPAKSE